MGTHAGRSLPPLRRAAAREGAASFVGSFFLYHPTATTRQSNQGKSLQCHEAGFSWAPNSGAVQGKNS